jgi:putative ATPase
MDLFESREQSDQQPLAYRMSPRSLDEYIGQEHIIGRGRLLRRVIQADRLSSLIFYGPPGTGKTALARVIARTTKSAFTTLNAVLAGVKDLRSELEEAKKRRDYHSTRTILFVDEVHRWNKAQQDALLPWVENGTVVLIGATTENPYFEVNSALVSRSRIFQLTSLSEEELYRVARQALEDRERGYGAYRVEFAEGALEHLIDVAAGDARSLLNAIELAVETTPEQFPPPPGETIHIDMQAAEESIQRKAVLYDKEGDYHFDVISAFIKSLRGSDPDAALYWLAKMVHAGEDPRFIFRRMLISACEDVGMADPHALSVVEAAAAAFDRVGMPEGRYHLTHAALYLATAEKSNSALGFFDALSAAEQEAAAEVPRHLKDANRDKEGFGHGKGYLYPHAYRDHWVAQQYLPAELHGRLFYHPGAQGYEGSMREKVKQRREAQLAAALHNSEPEVLSFSPPDSERERWLARAAEARGGLLLELRSALFDSLSLARHHRIAVLRADDGLLLWEALRRVPEGGVAALLYREETLPSLRSYAELLEETEQPELAACSLADFVSRQRERGLRYEAVIGYNAVLRSGNRAEPFRAAAELLADGGTLALAEALPREGGRLSELPRLKDLPEELRQLLVRGEQLLYGESAAGGHPLLSLDEDQLRQEAEQAGLGQPACEERDLWEERLLRAADLERWLKAEDESWTLGAALYKAAGEEGTHSSAESGAGAQASSASGSGGREGEGLLSRLQRELTSRLADTTVHWRTRVCILTATRPSRDSTL